MRHGLRKIEHIGFDRLKQLTAYTPSAVFYVSLFQIVQFWLPVCICTMWV